MRYHFPLWRTNQWDKFWPKVEERPGAQEAVQDAAAAPDDADARAALRLLLKKLLTEDSFLATELARPLESNGQVLTEATITQKSGVRRSRIQRARSGARVRRANPAG